MGFGRTARAFVLSPLMRQQLRPLLAAGTETKEDLLVLKELLETGKVTPVIDRTYPMSETPGVFCYVGERHTQEETVITV